MKNDGPRMVSARAGHLEQRGAGAGAYEVFVPRPLPPQPPLRHTPAIQELSDEANRALGRLDGVLALLPDADGLLYSYVRKEALLSSQIEGIQSTLGDLFEAEAALKSPAPDAVREVSNHVAAIRHGLGLLGDQDRGVDLDVLKECHRVLMRSGRGARSPGRFRTVQNWLGGASPIDAVYVPPPPELVEPSMHELAAYVRRPDQPVLIASGLVHAQFETIHPFEDGNGRVGRLLATLMLCAAGALREPLLYLSLYLKQRRTQYYERLTAIRTQGDWEGWIGFYLRGVRLVAQEAFLTALRITELLRRHREAIQGLGRAAPTALRLHELLCRHPIVRARFVAEELGVSAPTARKAIESLERLGYLRERTGKARGRVYEYSPYLAILAEGTEDAPG